MSGGAFASWTLVVATVAVVTLCPIWSSSAHASAPSDFVSLVPGRLLDRPDGRWSLRTPGGGSGRIDHSIQRDGSSWRARRCAIAVALNVVATSPAGNGYLTVYPCEIPRPPMASLNFRAGESIGNGALTAVGSGGQICVYTSAATQLVADLSGYFPATSTYVPLTPKRVLDTRPTGLTFDGQFQRRGPINGATAIPLKFLGRGITDAGHMVALNIAATKPSANGFLTVYVGTGPSNDWCSASRPSAASLNFRTGASTSNTVLAELSEFDLFSPGREWRRMHLRQHENERRGRHRRTLPGRRAIPLGPTYPPAGHPTRRCNRGRPVRTPGTATSDVRDQFRRRRSRLDRGGP